MRLPAVDRTEIIYADTTRGMVARGDWTDPRYGAPSTSIVRSARSGRKASRDGWPGMREIATSRSIAFRR